MLVTKCENYTHCKSEKCVKALYFIRFPNTFCKLGMSLRERNEKMQDKIRTVLETLQEVQKQCKKRSNKRILHKAIKCLVWILIQLEKGEQI